MHSLDGGAMQTAMLEGYMLGLSSSDSVLLISLQAHQGLIWEAKRLQVLLLALLQPTLQEMQHAQNEVHSSRISRLRYVETIFLEDHLSLTVNCTSRTLDCFAM